MMDEPTDLQAAHARIAALEAETEALERAMALIALCLSGGNGPAMDRVLQGLDSFAASAKTDDVPLAGREIYERLAEGLRRGRMIASGGMPPTELGGGAG